MAADYLIHYGTKRHSGRYPWGSGEVPYQHEYWFLQDIKKYQDQGLSEKDIAAAFGMTMRELRANKSNARLLVRQTERNAAIALFDRGMSYSEIARKMGKSSTTIKSYIEDKASQKEEALLSTVDVLKNTVDSKKYVDIGDGVATSMGISETRFDAAVQNLKNKGYYVTNIYVKQVGNDMQNTTVKVLAAPGTTKKDILQNRDKIALINEKFVDPQGKNIYGLEPIKSISSRKVMINYAEDGGEEKDGVIELRRGAKGLDLGESMYAQVRIAVDDTHYLKGMAVYADDLPDGVDIRFNTNKHKGTPKLDVLKKMGSDPDNPFGAQIKKGGQRGYLNIVSEESDWGNWSKTLASQMLSKQPYKLAKQQLNLSKAEARQEYEEIMSYKNPTVREYLLNQFADKCDTAAVDLKAAALPRQAAYVLLPIPSLKDNEIYAPKFKDGETVVLIRYPHGGTFEIPELRVNNKNKEGARVIGNGSSDAVGINGNVAKQLSGADFDGDTVVVIPNNKHSIKASAAREELQNFDTKQYKYTSTTPTFVNDKGEVKTITESMKQREMGIVSNLITDMTLKDAPIEHIVRAVKYSMVVIDSEKHALDYKQAARDTNINELKRIYQQHNDGSGKYGGASTLISRAGSEQHVNQVKLGHRDKATGNYRYGPNPETGKYEYVETGKAYTNKEGKTVPYISKVEAMRLTDDANSLSSGTRMESVYADYANFMKSLASRSRIDAMHTTHIAYSPKARQQYKDQVASLNAKIAEAESHAPIERKAQLIASVQVQIKRKEDPNLTKKQEGKIAQQALSQARESLGGSRPKVNITDSEWEAVQQGAVSKTTLRKVLRYADPDRIKQLAMPKDNHGFSAGQIALIKARIAAGYTQAQIAEILGVSASAISRALRS